MDLLTHGIMGAVIGQTGFHKKLGRKAIGYGACAAMLPDLDVISNFFIGPLAGMKFHRWITHSLWFGPVIGSILGLLFWILYERKNDLKFWLGLMTICLTTHPLLDVFTSYGTQLFSPFSDHRCSFDAISTIDFRFTGPLLIAVLLGYMFRKRETFLQVLSLSGFVVSLSYLSYTIFLNYKSVKISSQEWDQDFSQRPYQSLNSYPTLFQPYLRHLVLISSPDICIGSHRLNKDLKKVVWQCNLQFPSECARKLIKTPIGQRFAWFSDGKFRAEMIHPDYVRFYDMRYPDYENPWRGLWGVEGSCSSQASDPLIYFQQYPKLSQKTLQQLGRLWQNKGVND